MTIYKRKRECHCEHIKIKFFNQPSIGMKWTTIVACLIVCTSDVQGTNGNPGSPDGAQPDTIPLSGCPVNVDQGSSCSQSPIVALLVTLCSSSILGTLPAPALAAIVNALSATPQLLDALPPAQLVTLLNVVSSSSTALGELTPDAVLVLLTAVSKTAPSVISSLPRPVLSPLLKTLSGSGLLSQTVLARLPPLPPPPPQVVVPAPAPGPLYISLPKKYARPPPIVIPTGPPPSIVVSIPQPCPPPPPLILPNGTPGPIVINEDPNGAGTASPPVVWPAPAPPNIYFTTHPSKYCLDNYLDLVTGKKRSPDSYQMPPEMPKVYALPPGVTPSQYFQIPKTCS